VAHGEGWELVRDGTKKASGLGLITDAEDGEQAQDRSAVLIPSLAQRSRLRGTDFSNHSIPLMNLKCYRTKYLPDTHKSFLRRIGESREGGVPTAHRRRGRSGLDRSKGGDMGAIVGKKWRQGAAAPVT